MKTDSFVLRNVGPRENATNEIVKTIGVSSVAELIDKTIPKDIRLPHDLNLPKALSEYEFMTHIQELANKNKLFIILGIVLLAIFPLYNTLYPILEKIFHIFKLFPSP